MTVAKNYFFLFSKRVRSREANLYVGEGGARCKIDPSNNSDPSGDIYRMKMKVVTQYFVIDRICILVSVKWSVI